MINHGSPVIRCHGNTAFIYILVHHLFDVSFRCEIMMFYMLSLRIKSFKILSAITQKEFISAG